MATHLRWHFRELGPCYRILSATPKQKYAQVWVKKRSFFLRPTLRYDVIIDSYLINGRTFNNIKWRHFCAGVLTVIHIANLLPFWVSWNSSVRKSARQERQWRPRRGFKSPTGRFFDEIYFISQLLYLSLHKVEKLEKEVGRECRGGSYLLQILGEIRDLARPNPRDRSISA